MWQRHLQDAVHNGKRTFHRMFDQGVKFVKHLDSGMDTAKRLYGALHPLISQIGGQKANTAIMDVFQGYDRGKSETMGAYNQVQSQLNRIRMAAPEIGL